MQVLLQRWWVEDMPVLWSAKPTLPRLLLVAPRLGSASELQRPVAMQRQCHPACPWTVVCRVTQALYGGRSWLVGPCWVGCVIEPPDVNRSVLALRGCIESLASAALSQP